MKAFVQLLFRTLFWLPGADKAMKAYLLRNEGDALATLLSAMDGGELSRVFADERVAAKIIDAVVADNGQRLSGARTKHLKETLKGLFSTNAGLFESIARSGDSGLLKALLFRDDYLILRELLSIRSHEALQALVLNAPPEIFRMVVLAREGSPLAEVLLENDAKVLRDILQRQSPHRVAPFYEAVQHRLRTDLRADEHAMGLLETESLGLAQGESSRWQAIVAMADAWKKLAPHLPEDEDIETRLARGLDEIREPADVRDCVLDAITEDDAIRLAQGTLRFPCRHSLWTLLHEVLIHEDYYFSCDTPSPRIIDGGTHMGMALYYFKARFPQARILGFEPVPVLRALAEENVARNAFEDVEILPYALSDAPGDATFYASTTWSMAGSLYDRRREMGDEVETLTVPCVPLSDYLDEAVHFLKLDIEGAELEVLQEGASKLHRVHHIFCEVHLGGPLASDRLSRLLQLLEEGDFDVQVGKSHNFQEASCTRPFRHFDGAASMIVWARNRHWVESLR